MNLKTKLMLMKRVLLDTNFLLLPVQFKLDIFSLIPEVLEDKVEFFVVSNVIEELKQLAKSKGKDGRASNVTLSLLKTRKVEVIKTGGKSCDDALTKVAKDKGMIVATNDKELRKRLKSMGVKTIYLRSKKYLEVD